jgi:hypothetical protein
MLKYFTSTSDDISNLKLLIKTQGEITCQNNISIQTIKAEINNFDFGYLSYTIKAKSGSRSPRNFADKHILNGFILCSFLDEEEAMIDLVCSRKDSKIGKKLMEATEDFLREVGISKITLYSLPEEKLKRWYESIGYTHVKDININGEKVVKVHIMRKKL